MLLSELLKDDNRSEYEILRIIMRAPMLQEEKKKILLAIRDGSLGKLASNEEERKKYKNFSMKIPYDKMMDMARQISLEELKGYMDFIYNYYPGEKSAIREKMESILAESGLLDYTKADGGIDSNANIDRFKKKIENIIILNKGDGNTILSMLQEELASAVMSKALTGGIANRILSEVAPEYASQAREYLNQNYLGNDGRSVVSAKDGFAAETVSAGNALKLGENAPDRGYISSEHQKSANDYDNSRLNSAETGLTEAKKMVAGDTYNSTVTNAISNSGSGAITDDRAAIFHQLSGLVSYWDIVATMNKMKDNLHAEMKQSIAKAGKTSKEEEERGESLHAYLEEIGKCDMAMDDDKVANHGGDTGRTQNDAPDGRKDGEVKSDTVEITDVKMDTVIPNFQCQLERLNNIVTIIVQGPPSKDILTAFTILYNGLDLGACDEGVKTAVEVNKYESAFIDNKKFVDDLKRLHPEYTTASEMLNALAPYGVHGFSTSVVRVENNEFIMDESHDTYTDFIDVVEPQPVVTDAGSQLILEGKDIDISDARLQRLAVLIAGIERALQESNKIEATDHYVAFELIFNSNSIDSLAKKSDELDQGISHRVNTEIAENSLKGVYIENLTLIEELKEMFNDDARAAFIMLQDTMLEQMIDQAQIELENQPEMVRKFGNASDSGDN